MSADRTGDPAAARPARRAALPALAVALLGLAAASLVPGYFARKGPAGGAARRVERIVSLSPSTTETVFALGLGAKLIGVSSACDWPPEASRLPRMGDYGGPAVEKILAARPDLIVLSGRQMENQMSDFRRSGLPVYFAPDGSVEEIAAGFEELGRLAGAAEAGRKLSAELRAAFAAARARTARLAGPERPRVYVEISYDPVFAIGRDNFVDELVRAAGGANVLGSLGEGYFQPAVESIIRLDPEVIVLTSMTPDGPPAAQFAAQVARRPGWSGLSAVRHGRVWADLSPDLLLRPGPRLAEGLERLGARLAAVRGAAPAEPAQ